MRGVLRAEGSGPQNAQEKLDTAAAREGCSASVRFSAARQEPRGKEKQERLGWRVCSNGRNRGRHPPSIDKRVDAGRLGNSVRNVVGQANGRGLLRRSAALHESGQGTQRCDGQVARN